MQTLKIPIPKGYEIDTFDVKTGEVKLKESPKNIKEILQTFEDVLKWHNLTPEEFKKQNNNLTPDEVGHRKEKLIVAAYNNNELPDWTDGTYKYYPLFNMPSPSGVGFSYNGCAYWLSTSNVGSRQVFCGKDAKSNMLDAVKKFLPEYKESRTL